MKIYRQLYIVALCLIAATMVAADEGAAPDCTAECNAKVEDTWRTANGEIGGLRAEIDTLRAQLEEAIRTRDEHYNAREETQRSLDAVHAEKNDMAKARDDAHRDLEETRGQLKNANTDKANLEGQVATARNDAAAVKSDAEKAQSALSALRKEMDSKLAAEQAKVKAAQKAAADAEIETKKYSEARFLINAGLMQQDVKDFFSKLGLGSSSETKNGDL
mmetsp:Transcript_7751/g.22475  ORF Transcript_7751/g.22475 Transcript_7751/m.22475 type:complete len:219 (+) Transcript_7751:246-902(+)|eukprot:CAMPEP_0119558358 /NCGR_PEP_ID=MMETSP1352-20130426/10717_1 /TAXON_ID=265584 /ORGANISM="Stauroneis constricta, Strain CCMP1120" /LENGTH=218 /DNA_ID=CAMNT_0007605697 /DNA_START=246 /DNA_END=902 /DNA_ORIENTATION=+